jgi:hypothetical protein
MSKTMSTNSTNIFELFLLSVFFFLFFSQLTLKLTLTLQHSLTLHGFSMGISLLLPLLAPLDPLLLTPSQVLFRSTFRLLELLLTLKLLLALQLLLALKLLLAVLLPPAIQFLLLSTFSLVELSQPLLYTDHFFNPLKMHLLSLSSLVFFTSTLVFFKFPLNCIPIHGGILNF